MEDRIRELNQKLQDRARQRHTSSSSAATTTTTTAISTNARPTSTSKVVFVDPLSSDNQANNRPLWHEPDVLDHPASTASSQNLVMTSPVVVVDANSDSGLASESFGKNSTDGKHGSPLEILEVPATPSTT